ncbi:protein-glutamate methylesterase/protein-glutamine glutaminase [Thalassobacillus hwangdonensis]|uniref:Protein-glutamate methylesterase/protein-glutamine glutaminase n=1 Tax=Thalassobacillus hwangdonensis TaxID=546108 RepID=A0ABW3KWF9_9BACI
MTIKKVLVVDDSAFMRKVISDMLNHDPRLEVIAAARNGTDAIAKCQTHKPDVVTLDIEMPVMDGLTALEEIKEKYAIPVVMLSSLTAEGADSTVKAMQLGAVDFIQKPSGSISLDIDTIREQIVDKVVAAANANMRGIVSRQPIKTAVKSINLKKRGTDRKRIVAIGTSTGGPRALQQVLTHLPADFPAPIVIVQHMPPGFTKSLADRLNSISSITIKEASEGEILQDGTAYIAPGNFHMTLDKHGAGLSIRLDQSAPMNGHRPSVDALFHSIALLKEYIPTTVVMTGMGSDGAKGLEKLRQAIPNTYTITESEDSAVVFGMPKAVINKGMTDKTVPLSDISTTILDTFE